MPIALTEDHRTLGQTASDFLAKHDSRGAARALLEADTETLPSFWGDIADLGWLGLHLPEDHGGSGFGLPELVVVVEELGRALTPGPFVPTRDRQRRHCGAGSDEQRARLLPGLADGSVWPAWRCRPTSRCATGAAAGTAPAVLGGGLAHLLVLPARATTSSWSTWRAAACRWRCHATSTRPGGRPGSRSTVRRPT